MLRNSKKIKLILVIIVLALVNLACFTINLDLEIEDDGGGLAIAELIIPSDLEPDFSELESKGWELTDTQSNSPKYTTYTLEKSFSKDDKLPISDFLINGTRTIRESEQGYKYYKFSGSSDFGDIKDFWDDVQNDYVINGLDTFEIFGMKMGEFSAEEVQEWVDIHGPPKYEFTVWLPGQTPVDANAPWKNGIAYMEGADKQVVYEWNGKSPIVDLIVERRLEPVECKYSNTENIEEIKMRYEQQIPPGVFPWIVSGSINNVLIATFNNQQYICSHYQQLVMEFFDKLRTETNLLEGYDYGPIQTQFNHRSVVLFASCTDWRITGKVFDPWPSQRPKVYDIGYWFSPLLFIPFGIDHAIPDTDSGNLYPHLYGKTPSYPAAKEWGGDLLWDRAVPQKILLVRSPVHLLITMEDGRQIGVNADRSVMNELPGEIDFYSIPKGDNSGAVWWVFLPDSNFTVDLYGTGDGDFNVILADKDSYRGFGSQPIRNGEHATFSYDESNNSMSDMIMPDGSSIQSKTIPPEELDALSETVIPSDSAEEVVEMTDEADEIEELSSPEEETESDELEQEDVILESPEIVDQNNSSLYIFGLIMCCSLICLSAVGAGVFYTQYWSKRR